MIPRPGLDFLVAIPPECYGFVNEETKAKSFEPGWKCIKCFQNSFKAGCEFCPMFGGCFKMTDTLQWGHVSCSMWIPEVSFGDDGLNEYIMGVDNILPARWSLVCVSRGLVPLSPPSH